MRIEDKFLKLSLGELLIDLQTNQNGLSSKQASHLLKEHGENLLPGVASKRILLLLIAPN